jgi:putative SOS response-associated peptidase YedK
MCGRYSLQVTVEDLHEILPALEAIEAIVPNANVAPTQAVLAVADDAPTRLVTMRWGLIPRWAKDASIGSKLINARAETLSEKPAFRDAFASRRCIVPADGFYEWKAVPGSRRKQAVLVRPAQGKLFAFAGLWDEWRSPDGPVRSLTIVTTDTNDQLRELHERMPAMLAPSGIERWLARDASIDSLRSLLVPSSLPMNLTEVAPLPNPAASSREPEQGSLF